MSNHTSTSDDVIARHERALQAAQRRLSAAQFRCNKTRAATVRSDGSLRIGYAQEFLARDHQIAVLKERVTAAERALEHAKADLKRRQRERETAASIEQAAMQVADQMERLRSQLAKLEAEHAAKVEEAKHHRHLASKTQQELDVERRRLEELRSAIQRRNGRRVARELAPDPLPEVKAA